MAWMTYIESTGGKQDNPFLHAHEVRGNDIEVTYRTTTVPLSSLYWHGHSKWSFGKIRHSTLQNLAGRRSRQPRLWRVGVDIRVAHRSFANLASDSKTKRNTDS